MCFWQVLREVLLADVIAAAGRKRGHAVGVDPECVASGIRQLGCLACYWSAAGMPSVTHLVYVASCQTEV